MIGNLYLLVTYLRSSSRAEGLEMFAAAKGYSCSNQPRKTREGASGRENHRKLAGCASAREYERKLAGCASARENHRKLAHQRGRARALLGSRPFIDVHVCFLFLWFWRRKQVRGCSTTHTTQGRGWVRVEACLVMAYLVWLFGLDFLVGSWVACLLVCWL